jgi:hypothetical protein
MLERAIPTPPVRAPTKGPSSTAERKNSGSAKLNKPRGLGQVKMKTLDKRKDIIRMKANAADRFFKLSFNPNPLNFHRKNGVKLFSRSLTFRIVESMAEIKTLG